MNGNPQPDLGLMSIEEIRRLVYELETHQIELEVQNAELRRFQDELERSRDRYQELFAQAPFGHLVVTREGHILEANLAAADLLHTQRGRLRRRKLLLLVDKRDRPALGLCLSAVADGKRRAQCEVRLRARQGDETWANVELVASDHESDGGIRVFFWDISDRRAADDALRSERDRLASVLESIDDGVFIAAADRTLEFANAALIRTFGPYKGRTCHDYLCDRDENCPWCGLQDVPGPGGKANWRWHSHKVSRAFDAVATPLRKPDGSSSFLVMFRDVTESERVKAQLAEAAQRKDEFLALLAHELRNPLTPLLNSAELIVGSDDEAVVTQAKQIIQKQVWHMSRLIDDLLDVTRITTGKITLRRSPIDLNDVLQSAVQISQPQADARSLKLDLDLHFEPLVVDADVVRLSQVVSNLLTNAIKFTGVGGKIHLATRQAGNRAQVMVSDTGIGITKDELPHIFEMFTQSRGGIRDGGGLGVGLALTRQLVLLHSGEIHVHSPGADLGSTFVIELPLTEIRAEAIPAVDIEPSVKIALDGSQSSLRVLVVDDNQDSAQALGLLLQHLGHKVCIAYDSVAALKISDEFALDAAILDICMEGLNGYDLARLLRKQSQTKDSLLVALTGLGQKADLTRALEAGFDHHLVKPADPAVLQELLTRHERKTGHLPAKQ